MYKILIKMNSTNGNTYKVYGTSTSYSNGRSVFTEFETEDLAELKTEFMKLDKIYGFENLKVVMELDFSVDVDIFKSVEVSTVTTTIPVEDGSDDAEKTEDKKDTESTDNVDENKTDVEDTDSVGKSEDKSSEVTGEDA
jgi:hypothetical protein